MQRLSSLTENASNKRCVIKADGLAWCVGINNWSQVTHDGSNNAALTATQFDDDTASTIAFGSLFSCYVSCTSGATRCAGQNSYGQLGDGASANSATLVTAVGLEADACLTIK
jgi:alpha-tubulin suppressor-like RCC1 family protein